MVAYMFGNYSLANWTLEGWVRSTGEYTQPFVHVLGLYHAFQRKTAAYIALDYYGRFEFRRHDDTYVFSPLPSQAVRLEPNIWRHIALQKNGSNAEFYYNGLRMHTFAAAEWDFTGSAQVFVSGYAPDPNRGFGASMLDFSNLQLSSGARYTGTSFEPRFPLDGQPIVRAGAVPRTDGVVNYAWATNGGNPQVVTVPVDRVPLTDYFYRYGTVIFELPPSAL